MGSQEKLVGPPHSQLTQIWLARSQDSGPQLVMEDPSAPLDESGGAAPSPTLLSPCMESTVPVSLLPHAPMKQTTNPERSADLMQPVAATAVPTCKDA